MTALDKLLKRLTDLAAMPPQEPPPIVCLLPADAKVLLGILAARQQRIDHLVNVLSFRGENS